MPDLDATLGVRALRPVIEGLRALGHDPAPILRAAALDAAPLGDPDARIPARAVGQLWAIALEVTADPDLGLHLAEKADVAAFDLHAYALLSSPTLGVGFDRMAAYQRLINDSNRILIARHGPHAEIRHVRPGGLAVGRQPAEFLLAAWTRFARLATAAEIIPVEVRFAHAMPDNTTEHARIFRSPLRFAAGENAVVLSADVLEMPCARADPGLAAVLDRHALDRLERVPKSAAFADRARAALAEELQRGDASATRLAARLRMSVRSLSRALAAEGT